MRRRGDGRQPHEDLCRGCEATRALLARRTASRMAANRRSDVARRGTLHRPQQGIKRSAALAASPREHVRRNRRLEGHPESRQANGDSCSVQAEYCREIRGAQVPTQVQVQQGIVSRAERLSRGTDEPDEFRVPGHRLCIRESARVQSGERVDPDDAELTGPSSCQRLVARGRVEPRPDDVDTNAGLQPVPHAFERPRHDLRCQLPIADDPGREVGKIADVPPVERGIGGLVAPARPDGEALVG